MDPKKVISVILFGEIIAVVANHSQPHVEIEPFHYYRLVNNIVTASSSTTMAVSGVTFPIKNY